VQCTEVAVAVRAVETDRVPLASVRYIIIRKKKKITRMKNNIYNITREARLRRRSRRRRHVLPLWSYRYIRIYNIHIYMF